MPPLLHRLLHHTSRAAAAPGVMSQLLRAQLPARWAPPDGASCSGRPGAGLAPAARGLRASRAAARASDGDKEPQVVESGWLWQSNGKPGGSSATRMNLRDSGIKAKK
jgi:hypothetical protein